VRESERVRVRVCESERMTERVSGSENFDLWNWGFRCRSKLGQQTTVDSLHIVSSLPKILLMQCIHIIASVTTFIPAISSKYLSSSDIDNEDILVNCYFVLYKSVDYQSSVKFPLTKSLRI
jgi:hypothetical protein